MTHRIFGFGSLVTRATHDYGWRGPTQLTGYRRVWVPSLEWDVSLLSVEPSSTTTIDGVVLDVSEEDWPGLLERERGYDVQMLTPSMLSPEVSGVALFVGRTAPEKPAQGGKILLSYLDTVIAGFVETFGAERARAFFATTSGWSAGVEHDRAAPRYPRAIPLNPEIKALVDEELARLGL